MYHDANCRTAVKRNLRVRRKCTCSRHLAAKAQDDFFTILKSKNFPHIPLKFGTAFRPLAHCISSNISVMSTAQPSGNNSASVAISFPSCMQQAPVWQHGGVLCATFGEKRDYLRDDGDFHCGLWSSLDPLWAWKSSIGANRAEAPRKSDRHVPRCMFHAQISEKFSRKIKHIWTYVHA